VLAFTPNATSPNKGDLAKVLNKPQVATLISTPNTPTMSVQVTQSIAPQTAQSFNQPDTIISTNANENGATNSLQHTGASQFNGNWRGLVDELKLGLARALSQHCELIAYDEHSISLSVPETQKHLLVPNYQEKLSSAISQHFDKKIKLQFSIGGTGNTPAKQISQEKAHAQSNAESAIEDDSFVQALISDFGAQIIPNSIKPI
jgi:DNA polymerase-3 subunit gamma/tau